MNIEEVRKYAMALPGVEEDMPYGPDWLIFRIEGKIFLHIRLEAPEPVCAVKLDPDEREELREHYDGIRPAYHMNKTHWNDLYLEMLDDRLVRTLIEKSYMIVRSRLPKRLRGKYEQVDG
ncbi:MmcQ/YjbR family DNA-binding protein [Segatella buccae]